MKAVMTLPLILKGIEFSSVSWQVRTIRPSTVRSCGYSVQANEEGMKVTGFGFVY